MPLLALRFKFDSATKTRYPIELQHAIPKQPLRLVHYSLHLAAVDANLKTLLFQVPFLNNFDVNSNFDANDSTPVFNDPGYEHSSNIMDVEFNPSRSIDEVMDWKVYDQDGDPYESQDFECVLLFSYRRSDLI